MFKEKKELLKKFRTLTLEEPLVRHYEGLLDTYFQQDSDTISLKKIDPLHPNFIKLYNNLNDQDLKEGQKAIKHVAILKLNGGLGTTMGCEIPKSLIDVKPGITFLDCIIKQILSARETYSCQIPFLLLNSQATSKPTKSYVQKQFGMPFEELFQVNYPRFFEESQLPCQFENDPQNEWAPGGHGDVYTALWVSGLLESLLKQGIHYLFMSNSDNLGAELDLKILGYMAKTKKPFLLEATPRTPDDVKGGTLVRRNENVLLLERAQVAEQDLKHFEDITRFPIFNTNNIWVDLRALLTKIKSKALNLPIIANKKTINEQSVVQLETAMGAAIQCFENAEILIVPRSRFLPVKTTNELVLIRSDLFEISQEGHVTRNPKRRSPVLPKIELDPEHYDTVAKLEALIPEIPSLVEASSLKISGPVKFEEPLVIKGAGIFEY